MLKAINVAKALDKLNGGLDKNKLEVKQLCYLMHLKGAGSEGLSKSALAEKTGISLAGAGRNAKIFSDVGIVEASVNPANLNQVILTLSKKGQKLIDQFLKDIA